ncbi:S26 family signal peptidase [Streptomyces platensis]|uniref:S26 family signal peptidase n=1 Tax=Streptomyces platensis TaxID=58346 RepID=UPI00369664B2
MRAAATAVLWTVPTVGLIAVALIRSRYLVVTVEGSSMVPTLADGDRVLVHRTPLAAISAGRLVVTEPPTGGRWGAIRPSRWLIKRAAAVPGDPVPRDGAPALRDLPEKRVPQGRIVLLGDNPEESLDSRFCGYFRDEQIVGVVIRRLPRAEPHRGPVVTARPSLDIRKGESSWTT